MITFWNFDWNPACDQTDCFAEKWERNKSKAVLKNPIPVKTTAELSRDTWMKSSVNYAKLNKHFELPDHSFTWIDNNIDWIIPQPKSYLSSLFNLSAA